MPNTYVLIDYENVQPESLWEFNSEQFRVFLFLGKRLSKVPVDLVLAMQAMGDRGQIVQCSASGPNALDFHIAFYAGASHATDPTASIHVVANDKDYDPLIEHLKSRNVPASRVPAIADLLPVKSAIPASLGERFDFVFARLKKSVAKPGTDTKLKNAIMTMFKKELADGDIEAIVKELKKKKVVSLEGKKLVYRFPE